MIDLSPLSQVASSTFFSQASGISIDSRRVLAGEVFLALCGNNFDGHDYLAQAFANGAKAAIVEKMVDGVDKDKQIIVPSSIEALQQIASWHRNKFNIPVLALTGSSGKTTVKEMIAATLDFPHLATIGNLNNHLGVPLMLLKLEAKHQVGVFELGANHLGEIETNCSLVKPDIGLISNIGQAHVAEFGGIDNTEKAKGEIFKGVKDSGTLIVNIDDKRVLRQASLHQKRKVTVSSNDMAADFFASDIDISRPNESQFVLNAKKQQFQVSLKLAGLHNVENALMAIAASYQLGQDINKAIYQLSSFTGVSGRLQRMLISDLVVIDDSYNANVESVIAGISVLARESGFKALILGELAEVGDALPKHQKMISEALFKHQIDALYTVGDKSLAFTDDSIANYHHFEQKTDLVNHLKSTLKAPAACLVKGSRCAKMEEVIQLLK